VLQELTAQFPGLLLQDGLSEAEVEAFKETELWQAFMREDELGEDGEEGWLPAVSEQGGGVDDAVHDAKGDGLEEEGRQSEGTTKVTGAEASKVRKVAEEMERQMVVNSLKVLNRRMKVAREWVKERRETDEKAEGGPASV
jgi:hypothetical protein